MLNVGDVVRFKSLEQIVAEHKITLQTRTVAGERYTFPSFDNTTMLRYYLTPKREETFYVVAKIASYDNNYVVTLADGTDNPVFKATGMSISQWRFRNEVFEKAPEGTPYPAGVIKMGSLVTLKSTRDVPSAYRGVSFTTCSICAGSLPGNVEYFDKFSRDGVAELCTNPETREIFEVRYWQRTSGIEFTSSMIKSVDENYTGAPVYLPVQKSCSKCCDTFFISENADLTPEDANLCPSCRRREYVTPYHRYQPALTFFKTEADAPDEKLFFGIELEVDEGGESDYNAAEIVGKMNPPIENIDISRKWFMYCSHDGSLHNGLEMITAPATIKYHEQMRPKYDALFRDLKKKGYLSHNTNTCGMHVHFSREFMKDERGNEETNVCKLLYLVDRFWDDFVVFSRRDYSSLARYAKKQDINPQKFFHIWNRTGSHDGHYYAVNISNNNTIELRMFKGTLNLDTFMATLNFVNTIVRVAKEKTPEELAKLQFVELLGPSERAYYDNRLSQLKFCGLQD